MWYYKQSAGDVLLDSAGVGTGYSGQGGGLNNPELEGVKNFGPIPRGLYDISSPFKHLEKGPLCMRLSPNGHAALGRDGFMIHGDNHFMNHTASEGCIILARSIREQIANSGDKQLTVID